MRDGRVKGFAADNYPRLKAASSDELAAVRVRGRGHGLRWDALDEDIEVAIACREGAPEVQNVAIPVQYQCLAAALALGPDGGPEQPR